MKLQSKQVTLSGIIIYYNLMLERNLDHGHFDLLPIEAAVRELAEEINWQVKSDQVFVLGKPGTVLTPQGNFIKAHPFFCSMAQFAIKRLRQRNPSNTVLGPGLPFQKLSMVYFTTNFHLV